MPSKAYLKMLNDIPKEIQDDVIESVSIANEIHLVLKEKGLLPADLARLLNKSESEISKWLTGMHNFTFKTVRKIEDVLETKLLVTNSSKIAEYEEKLTIANKKILQLKEKVDSLNDKINNEFSFDESLSFMFSSSMIQSDSIEDRYVANFIPNEGADKIKIKAETKSTLSFQVFNC
ncbi:multiprotein-bridging factor 1 family protein [Maribacter sp. R77961]|uniref:multiprotein-bridging factor 1 family protein n=1 Tax=Maribacter sp. R77961 TaxID=3093871 RepID=UPI0037C5B231